jgi:hypothetical protein
MPPRDVIHQTKWSVDMRLPLIAFRSERFVISVSIEEQRRKLLQIILNRRDGSLFVNFPYFAHTEGIVSLATLQEAEADGGDVNLEDGGKATSHLVKYSHHPNGNVHFSQDGKVFTRVRKQAAPLDQIAGHLFTVKLQGHHHFELATVAEITAQPRRQKTSLNFGFGAHSPNAIQIAGFMYPEHVLRARNWGGSSGPQIGIRLPDGGTLPGFLCSAPSGTPGDSRVLAVTCREIPSMGDDETTLTFVGGFDPVVGWNKGFQFLAFMYPILDHDATAAQLGSIDFRPLEPAPSI